MNEVIRRAALRQTARLVGIAGVLGCSPTATQEARVEPLPKASATAAQTTTGPHLATPTPTCAIAVDADGGVVKGSLDCCLEATRVASSGKDGGAVENGDWKTTRPDLASCCRTIASTGHLSYVVYREHWDQRACFGCEAVLGQAGACTPWGPPMPPAMPPVA
jgi:hypothetical protein